MLSKYRTNGGNNGRSVRFNSGTDRDRTSHLRYTTDNLDNGFSLQKYSSGLDNYSQGKYTNTYGNGLDTSYQKLRHGSNFDGPLYRAPTEHGNYLDLSYRKLPPSYTTSDKRGYGNLDQLEPRLARGILKKNEAFLRRHLVLSRTVLDKLVDVGLIGDVMKRRILHIDATMQVPEIIRLLDDRGLGTLSKFLQVLRQTGSGWIADVLLDTDAIDYEDLTHPDDRFDPKEHYENRLVRYNHGALKRFDSADDLMVPSRGRNYGSHTSRAPSPDTLHRTPRVPLHDLLEHKARGYGDIRGGVRPGFFLSNTGALTDRQSHPQEVPRILNNLEGHFRNETDNNDVALSSLKQEEMAIRDLMDQNRREQQKVRKNQYTLMDINQKLKEVNVRTSEISDPTKNAAVSSYRLSQLNQIPWASSRY